MDIIFVRHGVPDFSLADERCMTQLEKDYAPLDRAYLSELHQKLTNAVFDDAQAIICSPYTRALQTAEILNRRHGFELFVEHDLREWRADTAGGYISLAERDRRWHEYRELLKLRLPISDERYEHVTALKARTMAVLERYRQYDKVIVVSHFNVFEALQGYQEQGLACGDSKIFRL
ncbi:TPA: histidine phosphatase family protein [Vibrio parahaemolyticus]|uniref:histidine phosphatase family protein n=1 Tax=Vibrio parahaemolyticus TaxID=670 RepID=UPI000FEC8066|nr:histidine phosphatase family protein [Vibrio parahaemolyticus]MCX8884865.1 phosphoglycerate mutase family protein [Vibrio parahaemolyticus]HAS3026658.1 histidine phosphatase family protein [Vibrio parahaemolyticus]HAS3031935.1 histidine phosphatase family protein [Vibrio parahaemolyticus]HAS3037213.1 histidine phosphatase family protein [Vibrio parahaemolyticus]HAS3042609.1 histidine phosphatase family protein [Vibrio parahaemolyticus]